MARAYVEVWGKGPPELFALEGEKTTVGRSASTDLRMNDPTVSQLHAVIESYGTSFALRDVGSANGTYLNGERVMGERRLRRGDEIRLGDSRLVFRQQPDEEGDPVQATAPTEGPPDLTRREREFLGKILQYNVIAGGSYNAEFTYENNGDSTKTGVKVAFYVSGDREIRTSDRLIGSITLDLAVGDVSTLRSKVTIPADLNVNTNYYLGAIIDPDDVIPEVDSFNATFLPIRVVG